MFSNFSLKVKEIPFEFVNVKIIQFNRIEWLTKKYEDPFCYPYQCPYRLVSLFFFKWSYGAHFVFLTPVELRNPPNIYLVREKVWVWKTPKNPFASGDVYSFYKDSNNTSSKLVFFRDVFWDIRKYSPPLDLVWTRCSFVFTDFWDLFRRVGFFFVGCFPWNTNGSKHQQENCMKMDGFGKIWCFDIWCLWMCVGWRKNVRMILVMNISKEM